MPVTHKDHLSPLRRRLHEVIFEADTPMGKAFDVTLLVAILVSVAAVMLESVAPIGARYSRPLHAIEWGFTILFTVEYLLRIYAVLHPTRYMRSFFGVVDLLAVLPTYLSLLVPGTHSLLVIRILRLLRIFRVFKLARYLGEAHLLLTAVKASRRKITVFLGAVLTVVVIVGALMYLIEGPRSGFTSIPRGAYWAIVTMTTVGYGDIAPRTFAGQTLASLLMILGYGIIAVPTGIFSFEMARAAARPDEPVSTQVCPSCAAEGHDPDAKFCKFCGEGL